MASASSLFSGRRADAPLASSLGASRSEITASECRLSLPLPRRSPQAEAKTPSLLVATTAASAAPAEDKGPGTGKGHGRRAALLALTAGASALVAPPWGLVAPSAASAADILQRIQRGEFQDKLKIALAPAVQANQELIPSLLRLALNDALSYDKASKTGGANASIRFKEELERPENAGLEPAFKLLEEVKATVDADAKGGPVSYADLIQFGASAALKRKFINTFTQKAGGDEKRGLELYRATGSGGQWGQFDKQFGRADADGPDPAGRLLQWDKASPAELKAALAPFGLKPRQIVVLSVFLSDSPDELEARLAEDPDFAPWVESYNNSKRSVSQNSYQVDLINTFSKVSVLGAPINTEAYSYTVQRKPLRF